MLITNTELRTRLVEAKSMLGSVYQLRHFASYTIDYERQCMTGHYYRLQYVPENSSVILVELDSKVNTSRDFEYFQ